MRPLGKFLCIKAVVFFSFFQGFAISILVSTGLIGNWFGTTDKNDIKDISSSMQNFLICIEMFFAAIAHYVSFSHKAYVDMAADQPNCCESFLHMWDVSDVKQDLQEHLGVVRNTVRNVIPSKVYRHPGGRGEERAHLLSSAENLAPETGGSSGAPLMKAGLDLAAEMRNKNKGPSAGDDFTDLSENDSLLSQKR